MRLTHTAALATAAMLVLSACSTGDESADTPAADAPSGKSAPAHPGDHESPGAKQRARGAADHGSGGGHAGGHGGGHGGHAGGHAQSADLKAMLLTEPEVKKVDKFYFSGAGHHSAASKAALNLDAACLPIAQLIGTAPEVQQTEHPQATTAYTKSHFGPNLSETIVDYGSSAAAKQALSQVERAGRECEVYRQSPARDDGDFYQVSGSEPAAQVGDAATGIAMDAVGRDFEKVAWDLTVVQKGQFLVAVGYQTYVGGKPTELRALVPTAVEKVA